MLKRSFLIENFKSIHDEVLELNQLASSDDSIGGVVTLIGPNNVGKSNVLKALLAYGSNRLNLADQREEFGLRTKDDLKLSISVIENDKPFKVEKKINLIKINGKIIEDFNISSIPVFVSINEYYSFFPELNNYDRNYHPFTYFFHCLITFYKSRTPKDSNNDSQVQAFEIIIKNLINPNRRELTRAIELLANFLRTQNNFALLYSATFLNETKNVIENLKYNNISELNTIVNNLYNLLPFLTKEGPLIKQLKTSEPENSNEDTKSTLIPSLFNVVEYNDKISFSNSDLSTLTNPDMLNSKFFVQLFSFIKKYSIKDVLEAYENFQKTGSNTVYGIRSFEKEINKRLEEVSKDFSKIYNVSELTYRFELFMETNNIYFQISEGERLVNFDQQSTGFKWFFNFYFNMYAGNGLKPGDIVVMDEPATNLHVSGQIELLKFIREFGKNNGLLFILSTHSPFLIDIDYLEELRIIEKDNIGTRITNKFNALKDLSKAGKNGSDLTAPIRSALTINSNVLFALNHLVIFVEGITDYGYLVALRNSLGNKHPEFHRLKFIPIDGVNLSKNMTKLQMETTLKNITLNPIVLVDGDLAGMEFKKKNANKGLEIITLKDIDDNFTEIEHLFSPEDRKTLGLHEKSHAKAVRLKQNQSLTEKLTRTTLANFEKVFDSLLK